LSTNKNVAAIPAHPTKKGMRLFGTTRNGALARHSFVEFLLLLIASGDLSLSFPRRERPHFLTGLCINSYHVFNLV